MKSLFVLICAGALSFGLSSCAGFAPAYSQSSLATLGLSKIQMHQIDGRNGFTLSQEMMKRAAIQTGQSGDLQLKVDLGPSRRGFSIRVDAVATRYEVQMIANWSLLDEDGKVLTKMRATGSSSFDSPDSPYASQVAEQNAEDRAVSMLADSIIEQLTFYFASQPEGS